MAGSERTGLWRNLAFVPVYGLSAVAVTAVFWRSNQPSADSVSALKTSPSSSVPTATDAAASSSSTVPRALTQSANFTANESYGISGSAAFVNGSTVLVKALSFNGTGPKVQLELRDAKDQSVGVLRDLTKLTLKAEDLVLAVPSSVDANVVTSIAIVAPDFKLVLSRATWR